MKNILFNNWHFMRFFRIALALFLFYNAYITHEWFFIVFGIFFMIQAVFNLGCSPNGCNVSYKSTKNE
ncbi:hypothetical protein [Flavobacterium capsici]|uniref:DUF2892 domain-containing protein n=1 Tax=Flavobacterium capsici TaxID=3075618 RepID=A0AA96EVN4_9FLAO|nr:MULTISPECIES: hypothetical protein [unclassified Flavobacterium]WNM18727.1 hypothetical protein RN608_12005 [Flavobacterium sp. PMR2A8]WNM22778.1 hypothetical protein RN605_05305 [Flavobacterium sp. PMTSA4]